MIVEIHDYKMIWKIAKTVDLKRGEFYGRVGYTGDQLFKYLIEKKVDDLIAVYVSFSEDKINGFIVLSVVEDALTRKKQVFFNLAWVSPEAGVEVGDELMKIAHEYARALGINEVNAHSSRNSKAMFKRFGFEEEYTSLTIKVKEGKNELLQEEKRDQS